MKLMGLSAAEVREKTARGETNNVPNANSRKYSDIFAKNIFTRFNFLLTALAVAVFAVGGGLANALFFAILVANAAIGIFQEIRAKRTLDKIAILSEPKVKVIREGKIREICVAEIVLGDFIVLKLGDQIVADGEILESDELEIDESLLTGESDPTAKKVREKVLSGSIVVAGSGVMRAEKIGAESYSAKLVAEAKKFHGENSEIQASINKLLKWISWSLVVVAPLLILGQLRIGGDWHVSALRTIAAIVGMIPNGLVMLASVAFMLAAVKLARKKVLVQRMPAVETLARVDTLLLDKTGTLTEGKIRFETEILEDETRETEINSALRTIASRNSAPTNNAISENFHRIKIANFTREIPFSSARKFSAITINSRNYVFGAPEILLADEKFAKNLAAAQKFAKNGKRVLVLCENAEIFDGKFAKNDEKNNEKFAKKNDEKLNENPENLRKIFAKNQPLSLVILSEKIRENAAKTLEFFREQNVEIKVISGDSPVTVAAIARAVGLQKIREFDARNLPELNEKMINNFVKFAKNNSEKLAKKARKKFAKNEIENYKKFAKIVAEHNVFGRVKPEQKRQIAAVLQIKNHVVAMTGDGVNDALALKKADLGIAMESGSAATKSVAEIVLMDNDFAHLPEVLAEGRRVIANIERVANLFIVKNIFVLVVALLALGFAKVHPYLPVQMSVIDFFAIGFPAFFLALAPNKRIYRPGFLRRILQFAIPVGIVIGLVVMLDYVLVSGKNLTIDAVGTSVSSVTMLCLLTVLVILSRPFSLWKITLISASVASFFVIIWTPFREIFRYQFDEKIVPTTVIMSLVGIILIAITNFAVKKFAKNQK